MATQVQTTQTAPQGTTGTTTPVAAPQAGFNNLYEAANQWATRPPDQRFWTVSEAHAAALAHRSRAVESEAIDVSTLHAAIDTDDPREVFLLGSKGVPARMTWSGFGRLCGLAKAPAGFLRTLPPALTASVLDDRLQARGRDEELPDAKLLFHRSSTDALVLRDVHTEAYQRIWNHEVTKRLLDLELQGWKLPPARPSGQDDARIRPATQADVVRCAHAGLGIKVGDPISPAGIYVSDHDLFAFLVDDTRPIDDGAGHVLYRGFFVKSMEISGQSLEIDTFLFEAVCGNHIVWNAQEVKTIRVRHVGAAREKTWADLAVTVRRFAESSPEDEEAGIRRMRARIIGKDKDAVLDTLFGLDVAPRKALASGYDRAEMGAGIYGDPRSVWGMMNGLTEYARDLPFADERAELDRAAGKIAKIAF